MALTSAITLAGNLTADPELKYGQHNNKPFVRVSIAVNPREYDREAKEWKDGEPVFWRGTAFGDLAEHIGHSLRKGQRVIVHGNVKADTWTDKDSGVKRVEKSIQIEDIGLSLLYTNVQAVKSAPQQEETQDTGYGDDTPF